MSHLTPAVTVPLRRAVWRPYSRLAAFSFLFSENPLTLAAVLAESRCGDWLTGVSSSNAAGRGGASIYGKQFEDELHPDLKFTGKCIIWLDWMGRESGF